MGQIMGASSQTENMQTSDKFVGHIGSAQSIGAADLSPVSSLLERLARAVNESHTGLSVLGDKLAPVSAPGMPTGEGAGKPNAVLPSQIEQRLDSLLSDIERLNRRIQIAHDELRI